MQPPWHQPFRSSATEVRDMAADRCPIHAGSAGDNLFTGRGFEYQPGKGHAHGPDPCPGCPTPYPDHQGYRLAVHNVHGLIAARLTWEARRTRPGAFASLVCRGAATAPDHSVSNQGTPNDALCSTSAEKAAMVSHPDVVQ